METRVLTVMLALLVMGGNAAADDAPRTSADMGLPQFHTTGGGDWHTAENWFEESTGESRVPGEYDIAYFGYRMTPEPAVVTFSDDAIANRIKVEGDRAPQPLTLELNGHTLTLNAQCEIKSPLIVVNGTITNTNRYIIDGGSLTIGSDATMTATGGIDMVTLKDGGLLEIAGGRLRQNTGLRDVRAEAGTTIHFTGEGGSIHGRHAELQPDATLRYTLANDGYREAPFVVAGIRSLGTLELAVAEDYEHNPGERFVLIAYGDAGRAVDGVEQTFTDLPEGAVLAVNGHQFQLSYVDRGVIAVTAQE
ncbi:hypothetical protein ACERK3_06460 [Phycisphaerales bacterium AB-hyl4]|uniref:Uncharacterized protein n=1 Tax=Natronomicrosphaera hydrolytica TaxID=3242702 RepID=A0ABV4U6N9_9BACT